MERAIEIIRQILRGVVLGGCTCVLVLFLYRCIYGPDPAVVRCAMFLTLVVVAANIVRNNVAEWLGGLVDLWRVWLKGNGNRGNDI